MISSVEITRFRGIREGKLDDLTRLVVLVGPNGCGKSSILDALSIAANSDPGQAIARVVDRHRGVNDGPRWLFWRAGEKPASDVLIRTGAESRSRCQLTLDEGALAAGRAVNWRVEWKSAEDASLAEGAVKFLRHGKRDCQSSGSAFREIPSLRLVESPVDDPVPLHELYSESARRGRSGQIKELIAGLLPALQGLEILTEGRRPVLYLVYKDGAVPAALAGDGIFALVRLAAEFGACSGGVLLLEEPEVHQHPGAIRQTMRAVLAAVRRDVQVVLTTHSLELIDCLLAESSEEDLQHLSLYRLQLEDGILISHRLSGPDVSFARTQIENDLR